MISNQFVSQLSQHDSQVVLNTLNETAKDLANSSNTLRKILTTAAAAFGLVTLTSLTTYAIINYRRKKQNGDHSNYLNDIDFESNLSKSKRPRKEIEEV